MEMEMEMMLVLRKNMMMISMMLVTMVMEMMMISPFGRRSPRRNHPAGKVFSSLVVFCLAAAAEN